MYRYGHFRKCAAQILISQYLQVECPTGSGDLMNLANVAEEIQHRVIHIFARDHEGKRAANGGNPKLNADPFFRDYVWFYEVRTPDGCVVDDISAHFLTSSISMLMMEEVLERPIRPDGERFGNFLPALLWYSR